MANVKEGRKKAQDIASLYKQTGNKFYVLYSEICGGNKDMLKDFTKSLNEHKVVGDFGKAIFSADDDCLIGQLFISSALSCKLSLDDLSKELIKNFPYVVETEKDQHSIFLEFSTKKTNTNLEIFPFKLRDDIIQYCIRFLKEKGLISTPKNDSDDEYNYAEEMGIEW